MAIIDGQGSPNGVFIKSSIQFVCAAALAMFSLSAVGRGIAFSLNTWSNISAGVYEQKQVDGTTIRLAFGAEGAAYDRARLNQAAEDAYFASFSSDQTASSVALLTEASNLLDAASQIPARAIGRVVPAFVKSGSLCSGGAYNYYFDSHFAAGKLGAVAVARAGVVPELFVPPPNPTSSAVYNSATVDPEFGSTVTSTASGFYNSTVPNAVADWQTTVTPPIASYSCTGSTFSSISLTGGACTSPAYVSLSKSYSTCQ